MKRTLTALLPDGTQAKRRTAADYRYIVAIQWADETWSAVTWSASLQNAAKAAQQSRFHPSALQVKVLTLAGRVYGAYRVETREAARAAAISKPVKVARPKRIEMMVTERMDSTTCVMVDQGDERHEFEVVPTDQAAALVETFMAKYPTAKVEHSPLPPKCGKCGAFQIRRAPAAPFECGLCGRA